MLNVIKKQEGSTLTVKLDGRLDTNTAPEFQSEVEPMLGGISKLILDFEKLDYLSSAGLEEQEKTMEVTNVNDIIHDVFDVTGFLDILTIV